MFEIALYQPCIPQNTGNIIRLAANTGSKLHIIQPSAFTWDDKRLIRSGLDYHEFAQVIHHQDWENFLLYAQNKRFWALTTHGKKSAFAVNFQKGDILLFGNESSGLNERQNEIDSAQKIRLPMLENSRSLNLANTVSIVVYEALRQNIDPNQLIF